MKPAAFQYHRAGSTDDALALLRENGYDAKLLAGGQSLIPAMNFRLAQPAVLIDLNRVDELSYIRNSEGALLIGAMTRQRAAERSPLMARHAPLLVEALRHTAHPQIRNRGTIGGSIAHADPAAEIPTVMLALGATIRIQGPAGQRSVPAPDFFTGFFGTALQPDEMVVSVSLPANPPRSGWGFEEIARRHGDFALAGVAAAVALDAAGRCDTVRIALFSVADRPLLAESAAGVILGHEPGEDAIAAAASAAAHVDIDPPSDIHASAAYRRRLVEVLTRRVLTRAIFLARSTMPG
ncbi:xanthine dehydrogenase family protein subunit M [soil metagenome]